MHWGAVQITTVFGSQVERQRLKVNMSVARCVQQNWTALPKEYYVTLWEEVGV